ncbi:MAG TPA: F0F1 ATP synthase subunit delta [Actinobacteria bacterium]|jgi:F-type H+-transporting ATPase subunit delta|nr:F0F1 ATP synthase subunit delta [Actinomycetota bacterium]
MIGSSRESLAACRDGLDARRHDDGFAGLSGELFAVASVLDAESPLRNVLADSGQPHSVREALVRQVFGGRVSDLALDLIVLVTGRRWASDLDLVLAIEQLADQAAFAVADAQGSLDATEEELFLFGRAVDASSELQMALTDPAQSSATKAAIVAQLLEGRATQATREVLEYAVGHLHGRRIDSVIDELCGLAAQQRERVVAEVRVAAPLDQEQQRRLAEALTTLKGRTVRLNVAVDPSMLGGVHVRIGDEVIDGSVTSRMEQASRAILG